MGTAAAFQHAVAPAADAGLDRGRSVHGLRRAGLGWAFQRGPGERGADVPLLIADKQPTREKPSDPAA